MAAQEDLRGRGLLGSTGRGVGPRASPREPRRARSPLRHDNRSNATCKRRVRAAGHVLSLYWVVPRSAGSHTVMKAHTWPRASGSLQKGGDGAHAEGIAAATHQHRALKRCSARRLGSSVRLALRCAGTRRVCAFDPAPPSSWAVWPQCGWAAVRALCIVQQGSQPHRCHCAASQDHRSACSRRAHWRYLWKAPHRVVSGTVCGLARRVCNVLTATAHCSVSTASMRPRIGVSALWGA